MLKIVVFDGGLGGEMVADFLETELSWVEVVRVIDREHGTYDAKSPERIVKLAVDGVQPYVGKADVIVLGGYAVTLAIGALRKRWPTQRFVGMTVAVRKLRQLAGRKTMILTSGTVKRSGLRRLLQRLAPGAQYVMPDCAGWEGLAEADLLSAEVLRANLSWGFDFSAPMKFRMRQPYRAQSEAQNEPSLAETILASRRKEAARAYLSSSVGRMERVANQKRGVQIAKLEASGRMAELRVLRRQLADAEQSLGRQPWAIVLLDTHFWAIREELAEVFSWGIEIVDFRNELLRDVCSALGLKGGDGQRRRGD